MGEEKPNGGTGAGRAGGRRGGSSGASGGGGGNGGGRSGGSGGGGNQTPDSDSRHPDPGGRPTGRPPGFSRDRATRAALDLFWAKGITSVNSSELASAMGIARSSFYNSFGSKEAVFGEALGLYAEIAPDRLLDAIEDGEPVLPRLAAFLRELCRVRAADPEGRGCMVCNGIAELAAADEATGAALQAALAARAQSMQRLFAQAQRQEELPAGADPAALADAFTAFVLGLNLMSRVVRDEARLQSASWQFLATVGVTA